MRWGTRVAVVAGLTIGLTLLRFVVAATLGLRADEVYYWLWSRNLALSYYDHPAGVAFFIRLSTAIAGDGPLGIRWLSVLLSAVASVGIYRLVVRLYEDRAAGLAAAALLQATLFIGLGPVLVTPDIPLVLFWLLALLSAAELWRTGVGTWWIAIGAAVGLAFLSKYSAVFLGFGIVLWTIAVPELRRWLFSPWPYLGGLLALALTTPVFIWNSRHEWASFAKQFGRAVQPGFQLRYLPEFLAALPALFTPFVMVLVIYGAVVVTRDTSTRRHAGSALLAVTTLPLFFYFLWHSSQTRVQGNWLACLVPACIAMAAVGPRLAWPSQRWLQGTLRFSSAAAVPLGVALIVLLMLHAELRLVPLSRDPVATTAGWRELTIEAERVAEEQGSAVIGTMSYAITAYLRYFGTGKHPVLQVSEPVRYAMERAPDPALLAKGPVLIVAEPPYRPLALDWARARFRQVHVVGTFDRSWKGEPVERFTFIAAHDPH